MIQRTRIVMERVYRFGERLQKNQLVSFFSLERTGEGRGSYRKEEEFRATAWRSGKYYMSRE
jgi:hypothetical protein